MNGFVDHDRSFAPKQSKQQKKRKLYGNQMQCNNEALLQAELAGSAAGSFKVCHCLCTITDQQHCPIK